jgi:1-acyl-sn-glycerol-3-phosphate acyltransferase
MAKIKDYVLEVERRKVKKPNWLIYRIAGGALKAVSFKRDNVKLVKKIDVRKLKGPYLVISNHHSRADYLYVGGSFMPQTLNIVAAFNEFLRSHLQWIFRVLGAIPKRNFVAETQSVRKIIGAARKGHHLVIFPEGHASISGKNRPVIAGIGKLVKQLNIPVYYTHLAGVYLTNRFYNTRITPGTVEVELGSFLTVEQLQQMSAAEIEDKISQFTVHDEYLWNKERRYKFDNQADAAVQLEQLLYWCPKCGKEYTMEGVGNVFKCKHCGNGATINEYYDLIPLNDDCVIPATQTEWYTMQQNNMAEAVKDPNFELRSKTPLGALPNRILKNMATSEEVGEGELVINHKGFSYVGTKEQLNADGVKERLPFSFTIDPLNMTTLSFPYTLRICAMYTKQLEFFEFTPEEGTGVKHALAVEALHEYHKNKASE